MPSRVRRLQNESTKKVQMLCTRGRRGVLLRGTGSPRSPQREMIARDGRGENKLMALDVKTPKGYRKAWNGGARPVTGVDLIAAERARQMYTDEQKVNKVLRDAVEWMASYYDQAMRE